MDISTQLHADRMDYQIADIRQKREARETMRCKMVPVDRNRETVRCNESNIEP